MPDLSLIWSIVELALRDRAQLALENAALRHQLAVLERSVNRAKIEDSDRLFWMLLRRSLKDWKDTLVFVKPATVVKWHRQGFRHYWRRKSRSKPGRPPIAMKVIMLIKRLSRTHQSLGGNAPEPRSVQAVGQVIAEPVLGGLHHRYSRAA